MKRKIFISSVQKEFSIDRQTLRDFMHSDPMLSRFFEVFLFEDIPASDRRADDVYLNEVRQSDIYLAILGNLYGYEDKKGISPTHKEFLEATKLNKHRLIFVYSDEAKTIG